MSKPTVTKGAILFILLVAFVAYAGNFHFLYGSGISVRKIPKVSWSLSETVVNADEIKGTPLLLLRARFPLLIQAVERGDF